MTPMMKNGSTNVLWGGGGNGDMKLEFASKASNEKIHSLLNTLVNPGLITMENLRRTWSKSS